MYKIIINSDNVKEGSSSVHSKRQLVFEQQQPAVTVAGLLMNCTEVDNGSIKFVAKRQGNPV